MLYEVALIQKPTKKEAEDGQLEKLIMSPTPVIAKDDRTGGSYGCNAKQRQDHV